MSFLVYKLFQCHWLPNSNNQRRDSSHNTQKDVCIKPHTRFQDIKLCVERLKWATRLASLRKQLSCMCQLQIITGIPPCTMAYHSEISRWIVKCGRASPSWHDLCGGMFLDLDQGKLRLTTVTGLCCKILLSESKYGIIPYLATILSLQQQIFILCPSVFLKFEIWESNSFQVQGITKNVL